MNTECNYLDFEWGNKDKNKLIEIEMSIKIIFIKD